MAIGIISHGGDDHAAAVSQALLARGAEVRLVDTADFPSRMRLSFAVSPGAAGVLMTDSNGVMDLGELDVIWWRRPRPYEMGLGLDPALYSFAYSECHEAMAGAWHSLDVAWVNPPDADEVAHHKPLQLALARSAGLAVPATLVTNDPAAARRFIDDRRPQTIICKTFIAQEMHWRETRAVGPAEEEALDTLRLAPAIFQEFVEAEADVRVTIFGDRLLAAEIVSHPSAYAYDYRVAMDRVVMRPADIPPPVARALLKLMRSLGLVYGAADLRRTASGEHIFLEVNPAGEFLFVEERSGLRLTEEMASLLVTLEQAGRKEQRRTA